MKPSFGGARSHGAPSSQHTLAAVKRSGERMATMADDSKASRLAQLRAEVRERTIARGQWVTLLTQEIETVNREYDREIIRLGREIAKLEPPKPTTETTDTTATDRPKVTKPRKRHKEITLDDMRKALEAAA